MRPDLQKVYDWTDNPPVPGSTDCTNVLNWMTVHGAPPYKIYRMPLGSPIGIVPWYWVVQFQGMSYPCDLALTLDSPDSTLQTISNIMRLDLVVPVYTPPAVPPTPASVLPQPANPVGAPENPNLAGVGAFFAAAPGDTLPVSSLFPNPPIPGQPIYQKVVWETPFGNGLFWERIA